MLTNMFLMDRINELFRKIVMIIAMFFFCFGLDNCKSLEEPGKPEPNYEYRYNVEVIYTRVAVEIPEGQDTVSINYLLRDPALFKSPYWEDSVEGSIVMTKIGENKFRYYLSKVFVQTPINSYGWGLEKHRVSVVDYKLQPLGAGENIDIQGAYELEVLQCHPGSRLEFKMSKN